MLALFVTSFYQLSVHPKAFEIAYLNNYSYIFFGVYLKSNPELHKQQKEN